jgi:germination protein M
MTRRAAAGLGRLLPLMLIAAAAIIVAGAALLGACGVSNGGATQEPTATVTATPTGGSAEPAASSSASPPAATATTLRLYFLRDGKLGVAERLVPHTSTPATASLKALFAGPRSGEQQAGLSTAIPSGVRLLALSIDGGVAHADLSAKFAASGSEEALARRGAEVVYTLTRFPTVRRVTLTVDGAPFSLTGTAGAASGEWGRSAFARFEPNIFVEQPGVGAVVANPVRITGTAMVFEGSFIARLVDSSGRRIVNATIQASRGAPERGKFAKDVPFSTSAQKGTLIVYDQSMENGSRMDEVRIPVTFTVD